MKTVLIDSTRKKQNQSLSLGNILAAVSLIWVSLYDVCFIKSWKIPVINMKQTEETQNVSQRPDCLGVIEYPEYMCEGCGKTTPDKSLIHGGFNIDICNNCRPIMNETIDTYFKLYHNKTNIPDFSDWTHEYFLGLIEQEIERATEEQEYENIKDQILQGNINPNQL